MNLQIRREENKDLAAVNSVIEKAFQSEPMSDQTEHLMVERLRKSTAFIPELSIVAELDNSIVGHILLTKLLINNNEKGFQSLALAPVSVLPDFQKKGIGGKLITSAHELAKKLGHTSIILVGYAEYYPRFGYRPSIDFGIKFPFEVPLENGLAIELVPNSLKDVSGIVSYPQAFFG